MLLLSIFSRYMFLKTFIGLLLFPYFIRYENFKTGSRDSLEAALITFSFTITVDPLIIDSTAPLSSTEHFSVFQRHCFGVKVDNSFGSPPPLSSFCAQAGSCCSKGPEYLPQGLVETKVEGEGMNLK